MDGVGWYGVIWYGMECHCNEDGEEREIDTVIDEMNYHAVCSVKYDEMTLYDINAVMHTQTTIIYGVENTTPS